MPSICFFCKNSGEDEKDYTNHTKHTCQKLANITCLKCGDKGHTERYCNNSGKKYTAHVKKDPVADGVWQEVKAGVKKTPLVFHVGTVVADERPVTPPKIEDEAAFPTFVDNTRKVATKLNFAGLNFKTPKEQTQSPKEQEQTPKEQTQSPKEQEQAPTETVVTSDVADEDFPDLTPARRSPPTRPVPMPPSFVEIITTLTTSLQFINSRYDAKCQEYDTLLAEYNALKQQQKWGAPAGTSWADEPMN